MTEIEKSEFLRPIFNYDFCSRIYRGDYIVFTSKYNRVYWLDSSDNHFVEELNKSNEISSVNEVVDKDDDFIVFKTIHLGIISFIKMKMGDFNKEFVFSVTAYVNGEWL